MRDTFLRLISDDKRNKLYDLMQDKGNDSGCLTKIILLNNEGYIVPEIRMAIYHHDVNIRKWIHRFNVEYNPSI